MIKWYKQFKKDYPTLYFAAFFLAVAAVMFAFFSWHLLRPICFIKGRMVNTEISWGEVRKNIEKTMIGDSKEVILELMGEPDEVINTYDFDVWSYQRYGAYKASFRYDIEFRADTLSRVMSSDMYKKDDNIPEF